MSFVLKKGYMKFHLLPLSPSERTLPGIASNRPIWIIWNRCWRFYLWFFKIFFFKNSEKITWQFGEQRNKAFSSRSGAHIQHCFAFLRANFKNSIKIKKSKISPSNPGPKLEPTKPHPLATILKLEKKNSSFLRVRFKIPGIWSDPLGGMGKSEILPLGKVNTFNSVGNSTVWRRKGISSGSASWYWTLKLESSKKEDHL